MSHFDSEHADTYVDSSDLKKKAFVDADVEILEAKAYDPSYPTLEEKNTLRRIPGPIKIETFLIGLIELLERFSYYGTTAVFTNFLQRKRPPGSRTGAGHSGQSGALGMGQQATNGLVTFNQFWIYVTPLLGGYMADTYWGRYKTIGIAVAIAQVGHILLTVSAIPSVIDNPNGSIACFSIALIIMGLGTGGFKSSISPMVADQSSTQHLKVAVTKKGERVLHDPALTTSRLMMWFYMLINIGALGGQIGMVYAEKYVGFWLSFLLPTLAFFLAPVILFAGRNRYNRVPPNGSAIADAIKFIGFAAKGKWLKPKKLFAADFWESSKPSTLDNPPAWMVERRIDDLWVDELRRAMKACEVFVFYPLYWLPYNQINNNLTAQAATMNTHGLPNDVLNNLDPFALILIIPICDLIVYPFFRRIGFQFTPIKKIFGGFMCGSVAMVCAAVVQHYIYKKSPCGYQANTCDSPANINVWAQTPSYVLIAMSEIFASITGLEYAITTSPKSMRTIVMGVFLFTSAISAAIGEAFNALSTDPNLVWNYGVFAVVAFIGGIFFWLTFYKLDKEEARLNDLGTAIEGKELIQKVATNDPHVTGQHHDTTKDEKSLQV